MYEFELIVDDGHPVERLKEALRARWHYETGTGGAEYANSDTGVRFELDWATDGERIEALRFRMERRCPRVFGEEAREEMSALAEKLGVDLDSESFVEEWREANRREFEREGPDLGGASPEARSLAREDLREAWRWNRERRRYQSTLGGDMFVPRVLFFSRDGEIQRGIIWPDAIPVALPRVELVLVTPPEEEQEEAGMRVVDRATLRDEADPAAESQSAPVPHVLLRWDEPPAELVRTVRSAGQPADPEELSGLPPRRIFEAEFVENWLKG